MKNELPEGWKLEKCEAVQIGYHLPGDLGHERRHRKIKGWWLSQPDGYQRHFDRKTDAIRFAQEYGDSP